VTDDERCLDEIRDLQAALVMVLESHVEPSDKGKAARRLLTQARAHPMPGFALRAMQWVLERDLDELFEEADGFGDAVERRLLGMHARGETRCQRCLRELPARSTIERWQRERALAAMWGDWLRARSDRGAA
jgi:hypothetical protein